MRSINQITFLKTTLYNRFCQNKLQFAEQSEVSGHLLILVIYDNSSSSYYFEPSNIFAIQM